VPTEVAWLIGELTARDPVYRPATAGDVAWRAGQLRDALAAGATERLASDPGGSAAFTRVLADPVTLTGLPAPDLAPPGRESRHGSQPRRGTVLAVAAAIVAAGLAGWLLRGGFGAAPPQHPVGTPRPAASTPSVRTVAVNAGALTGQPAHLVRQQLVQLGLQPHVVWVPADGQDPGTVLSVQPNGQVPAGSVVTVTAAGGHHDGQGNGQGDGGGGDGGGGGG
jgi:uncharacterized membrane protein YgcG